MVYLELDKNEGQ